jgi:hypothetical protein
MIFDLILIASLAASITFGQPETNNRIRRLDDRDDQPVDDGNPRPNRIPRINNMPEDAITRLPVDVTAHLVNNHLDLESLRAYHQVNREGRELVRNRMDAFEEQIIQPLIQRAQAHNQANRDNGVRVQLDPLY